MVSEQRSQAISTDTAEGLPAEHERRNGLAYLDGERRSAGAWRRGADGDPHLVAELEAGLGVDAVVLHGRTAPATRGGIDHLVVAGSGVWIVDAKNYWGVVERRDIGNWQGTDHRLFVNGRDETESVEDITWQAAAVRAVLDPIGFGHVPVHPVLLFVGSGGRWFMQPIAVGGVRAMWAKQLIERVSEPGPITAIARRLIAAQLDAELPALASASASASGTDV